MIINKAYKVELDPNNVQKTYLNKSIGIARLAYNWGLSLSIKRYDQDKKHLSYFDMHKELCKVKKVNFPFMYEVSKCSPQSALRDLDIAFKNFFRGIKQKRHIGFPKFKAKKTNKKTFRIDGMFLKISKSHIKLPKVSLIKLKEYSYIPTENVKYMNATISKEIDKYFVSVVVQYDASVLEKPIEEIVGIDLGIKELATCSNGDAYFNPKYTNKYAKNLRKEQKSLSRKKIGSINREKQRIKVAKVHRKIRNSRLDNIHKMTSSITKAKCRMIILEDLNVRGMLKNHKLAKAIADSSFYEIKRQLDYKTLWYGGKIHTIDRWFPSSKTCSSCESVKKDLKLSDRVYNCDCGLTMDRDLNAAINIQNNYTVSSTEFKAYGESVRFGSDLLELSCLNEVGIKQEISAC